MFSARFYACKICGRKAEHIHHGDGKHNNNLRLNLIPLCRFHHVEIHKIARKVGYHEAYEVLSARDPKRERLIAQVHDENRLLRTYRGFGV